jgi:hypothetical protein
LYLMRSRSAACEVTPTKTNTAKMRFKKCMGGLWGKGEIFQPRKCAAGTLPADGAFPF